MGSYSCLVFNGKGVNDGSQRVFPQSHCLLAAPVSRNYFPGTWGWGQKGEEMGAQLSVTSGFVSQ